MYLEEGRSMDSLPAFRFVTASLHIDYLAPTPIDAEIEIRGRVKDVKGRRVVVEATVSVQGRITARGEVVAVQMPESFSRC
jgi:acyl-CoA thioesterase FadM